MTTQQLQPADDQPMRVIPPDQGATILAVISRAASDPSVDIDKMERLMQMHERMQARTAEGDFNSALSMMQPELPSVGERGGIKDRNGNIQSTYALWEDINQAIKPIMQRHGFALSFRTECGDGISVTGVLSHKAGHSERTTIKLPADKTGSKNDVQAVASSVSYGKRYTAGALLNLTSHGEDDDAFAAGSRPEPWESDDFADWRAKVDACATAEDFAAAWKEMSPAVRAVMQPYVKQRKAERVVA